jgi:hypothetical protein
MSSIDNLSIGSSRGRRTDGGWWGSGGAASGVGSGWAGPEDEEARGRRGEAPEDNVHWGRRTGGLRG